MSDVFKAYVELEDKRLRRIAMDSMSNAAFIERLMIVENESTCRLNKLGLLFDLIVFDNPCHPSELLAQSERILDRFPGASLIHVNSHLIRCDTALPLINLPYGSFATTFPQLLSLCYISFLLQHSFFGGAGKNARCA